MCVTYSSDLDLSENKKKYFKLYSKTTTITTSFFNHFSITFLLNELKKFTSTCSSYFLTSK